MNLTANQLARVCAATVSCASRYVVHLNAAMDYYDIFESRQRMAMFLAQISYESQRLSRVEENLSYSAKRLMAVWPRRFPTLESAQPYVMNPKALANKVYANRLGNGDEASGDGWLYRGRGLKQLTGSDNYHAAERALGLAITGDNAGRVALPEGAAWTACWFWHSNRCNAIADAGDYARLTKVINGALTGHEDGNDDGLDDRVELLAYTTAQLHEVLA
jgi:putative chitinase